MGLATRDECPMFVKGDVSSMPLRVWVAGTVSRVWGGACHVIVMMCVLLESGIRVYPLPDDLLGCIHHMGALLDVALYDPPRTH